MEQELVLPLGSDGATLTFVQYSKEKWPWLTSIWRFQQNHSNSNPEYHSKYTQNDSNDDPGNLPQFYGTCKGQGQYNMLFIIIIFEAISG